MDFAVWVDNRVKIIENENRDKNLDLARELKKNKNYKHESDGDTNYNWCAWNDPQGLVKRTGRVETIQTTALLRSVRTFRKVIETCENLQSLKLQ